MALWFQMVYMVSLYFLVPLVLFLTTLSKKAKNKLTILVWFLFSLIYTIYIYSAGRWDWVGYYFRYVLVVGLLYTIYRAYRNQKRVPFWPERRFKSWGRLIFPFVMGLLFLFSAISSVGGRYYEEEAISLHFPLRNGVYYVAHGGNTSIINYHNTYLPQQFALDIVKINPWGFRAKGWYPDDLHQYAIFGDPLYSPCKGIVREAVDGFEDRTPSDFVNGLPEGTPAAGNFAIIDCDGTDVLIAHMQEGSLQVKAGDVVDENSWIGNVGNSGNTSEPHLHIHAEKNGIGVPFTFDDRFLVRNNLVRASE